ncbi:hypothetical protein EV356DRAFT_145990 [Viridothelium virens]|uniref:DC-UbP/UBTD2 N-terminal domain-containing protein n=1 Tax=Viridothelium virens TaxID=1048519 RepID=A0A6A6H9R8_VIRVR|nr:hypothetical protein EV356DRAFT_145990 [Viridothelium virens]
MGCCTSKEAAQSDSTPYPNAPCAPVPSNDPPPSQPRPTSPNRRSASVNSSLAPATDTGLDSSRTNIIQPPASPSPSPLPHNTTSHTTTTNPISAPTSASTRPSSPPPSKRNPRRRSLFARTTNTNTSSSQPARSNTHDQRKSSTATTTTSTERPNAPLCAPSPVLVSPRKPHIPDALQPARPWRRRVLAQQRAEFFDTQTGGREEVWAVVRFACEAMREAVNADSVGLVGGEGEGDGEGGKAGGGVGGVGLADAQGILDAAGLTCPSGRMRDGVYDAQGNRYVIPNWVVRDPEDVVDDEEGEEGEEKEEVVRVEKGKGRMVEEEQVGDKIVTVKIRRSDPETNYKVRLGKGQSVGTLIQHFREEAQLPADVNIRIFFLGKQMSETKSLAAQTEGRWRDGDVVIAFVSQR